MAGRQTMAGSGDGRREGLKTEEQGKEALLTRVREAQGVRDMAALDTTLATGAGAGALGTLSTLELLCAAAENPRVTLELLKWAASSAPGADAETAVPRSEAKPELAPLHLLVRHDAHLTQAKVAFLTQLNPRAPAMLWHSHSSRLPLHEAARSASLFASNEAEGADESGNDNDNDNDNGDPAAAEEEGMEGKDRVRADYVEAVRWLLVQHPEAVCTADAYGDRPFHVLCRSCHVLTPELCAIFAGEGKYGNATEAVTARGCGGATALHLAVSLAPARTVSLLRSIEWMVEQHKQQQQQLQPQHPQQPPLHSPEAAAAASDAVVQATGEAATTTTGAASLAAIVDDSGDLPLHVCLRWHVALEDTTLLDRLHAMHPRAVRVAGHNSALALHCACSNAAITPVALRWVLAKYPRAARTPDQHHNLPMHLLARWTHAMQRPDLLEELFRVYAAALWTPGWHGRTPFHRLVCNPSVAPQTIMWANSQQVPDVCISGEGGSPSQPEFYSSSSSSSSSSSRVDGARPCVPSSVCHVGLNWSEDADGALPVHLLCQSLSVSVESLQVICGVTDAARMLLAQTCDGSTPLHVVVANPAVTLPIVQFMLRHQPSALECSDRHQLLPLHVFLEKSPSQDPAILAALLAGYPSAVAAACAFKAGLPLHCAARNPSASLECLVFMRDQYPAALATPTPSGSELPGVHTLLQHNRALTPRMLSDLISPRLHTMSSQTDRQRLPVHCIAVNPNVHAALDALRWLVSASGPDAMQHRDIYSDTALHTYVSKNKHVSIDVLRILHEAAPENMRATAESLGNTVLHALCSNENAGVSAVTTTTTSAGAAASAASAAAAVVQWVAVRYPAACQITNAQGQTPVHVLCSRASPPFLSIPVVATLLSFHPAAASQTDQNGNTPLHLLAQRDNVGVDDDNNVLLWLANKLPKTTFERRNKDGLSAFHVCCEQNPRPIPTKLAALVGNQAATLAAATPTARRERLAIHLLCANTTTTDSPASIEASLEWLLARQPEVAAVPDARGDLPLHILARSCRCISQRLLSLLIQANAAALAIEGSSGFLPLHALAVNPSAPLSVLQWMAARAPAAAISTRCQPRHRIPLASAPSSPKFDTASLNLGLGQWPPMAQRDDQHDNNNNNNNSSSSSSSSSASSAPSTAAAAVATPSEETATGRAAATITMSGRIRAGLRSLWKYEPRMPDFQDGLRAEDLLQVTPMAAVAAGHTQLVRQLSVSFNSPSVLRYTNAHPIQITARTRVSAVPTMPTGGGTTIRPEADRFSAIGRALAVATEMDHCSVVEWGIARVGDALVAECAVEAWGCMLKAAIVATWRSLIVWLLNAVARLHTSGDVRVRFWRQGLRTAASAGSIAWLEYFAALAPRTDPQHYAAWRCLLDNGAESGRLAVLHWLWSRGVSATSTSISVAATSGWLLGVCWLVGHAERKMCETPLEELAAIGDHRMLHFVLHHFPPDSGLRQRQRWAFAAAAKHGHLECLKLLDTSANICDTASPVPIWRVGVHHRLEIAKPALDAAAEAGHTDVVRYLLKRKYRAHHLAKTFANTVANGHEATVLLLLEHHTRQLSPSSTAAAASSAAAMSSSSSSSSTSSASSTTSTVAAVDTHYNEFMASLNGQPTPRNDSDDRNEDDDGNIFTTTVCLEVVRHASDALLQAYKTNCPATVWNDTMKQPLASEADVLRMVSLSSFP